MNPIAAIRDQFRELRRHRRIVNERIVVRALIDTADDGEPWVTGLELSRMVKMRGRLYPILDDLEERGLVEGRYSAPGRRRCRRPLPQPGRRCRSSRTFPGVRCHDPQAAS